MLRLAIAFLFLIASIYLLVQLSLNPVMLFVTIISTLYFALILLSYLFYEERKTEDFAPPVSIIVPAYNEEENIAETIQGLLSMDYPEFEIIVVDDGSTDRTYEIAKRFEGDRVKVFRKKNGGKASALNFGLKHVSYDFVACMDADSVPSKNALREIMKLFLDEDVGAVTPALLVYKPGNLVEKFQWAEYLTSELIRRVYDHMDAQYVTPGPLSVYRKKVLDEVGPFNENSIVEDLEMAIRIQHAGYRIAHASKAAVYTKTPRTWRSLLKQRLRWNLGAVEHLFSKHNLTLGNLGVIVIPFTLLGISIVFILFFKMLYDLLKPLEPFFTFLKLGGHLTVKPTLDTQTFLASTLSINPIQVISFIITLFAIYFVLKLAKEYNEPIYWDGLLLFLAGYFLFSFAVWSLVIYYKVLGGEIRFGGVTWRGGALRRLIRSSSSFPST